MMLEEDQIKKMKVMSLKATNEVEEELDDHEMALLKVIPQQGSK